MKKTLTADQAGLVKNRLLQARQARETLERIEAELVPIIGHPYHVENAVHLGYGMKRVEDEFRELCKRADLVVDEGNPSPAAPANAFERRLSHYRAENAQRGKRR